MCNFKRYLTVKIPERLSYTGKDRYDLKEIDECIFDIVKSLNCYGISTIGSCCGHGRTDGEILLEDGRKLIIKYLSNEPHKTIKDW